MHSSLLFLLLNRSLCDATTYVGTSCAGMMEGFGTAVNCSLDTFDQGDNAEQCNNMESSAGSLLVANDQEVYIGETCQGVLTGPVATPSVDTIDPNFAPYLPPYVAQSITEGTVAGWVGSMPVMAHGACLVDFRKMACGLMLPVADVTNALDFLFGPLSVPSFPHQSVCTEFMESCANAFRAVPLLAMDCNAKVGTIDLFPNDTQTIISLNLGFGDILLQSEPNYMNDTTIALETQCPHLLTVPEDPRGKYVNWIDGFNCALQCPLPVHPEDFTDDYFSFFKITQWASLFIISVAVFNLQVLTTASKRNPYLQLILAVLWVQACITLMLVQNRTQDDVICKDNAQSYSYEDAGSGPDAFGCTTVATFTVLHDNILFFTFIAMTSELFSRVILEAKSVEFHKLFYVYGASAFMLVLTLLQLFFPAPKNITHVEGGWSLTCLWTFEDVMTDYYLFTLPKIVIYVVCSTMSIFTALRTMRVTQAVSGSFQKMWKSYRVLYVSLILFVGTFPLILFVDKTYYGVGMKDKMDESNTKWFVCIISEFIGGNEQYMSTCGQVSEDHYPFFLLYFMLVFYYLITPLGNLWASFSKEARDKWHAKYTFVKKIITAGEFPWRRHHREVKVVPVATIPPRNVIDISLKITPPCTERDNQNDSSMVASSGEDNSSSKYQVTHCSGSDSNA